MAEEDVLAGLDADATAADDIEGDLLEEEAKDAAEAAQKSVESGDKDLEGEDREVTEREEDKERAKRKIEDVENGPSETVLNGDAKEEEKQAEKKQAVEKDSEKAEEEEPKQSAGASVGFAGFSSLASSSSPFATVGSSSQFSGFAGFGSSSLSTNSGPSPFATFAGPTSAFGEPSNSSATEDASSDVKVFASGEDTNGQEEAEDTVFTGEEDEDCTFKIRAKLYRLTTVENKPATAVNQNTTEGGIQPSSGSTVAAVETSAAKTGADESGSAAVSEAPETEKTVKKEYREMGSGWVKINVPKAEIRQSESQRRPRIVMRREGVYKLLLNANIWETMPIVKASDKVLRFSCTNVLGESETPTIDTFILRLPRVDQCDSLFQAIQEARKFNSTT